MTKSCRSSLLIAAFVAISISMHAAQPALGQEKAQPAASPQANQAPGFAMGAPAGPSSPEVLGDNRVFHRPTRPPIGNVVVAFFFQGNFAGNFDHEKLSQIQAG